MQIYFKDQRGRLNKNTLPTFFIISKDKKSIDYLTTCREYTSDNIRRFLEKNKQELQISIGINSTKQENEESAIFAISSILKECSKLCRIKIPKIKKLVIKHSDTEITRGLVFVFENDWFRHTALISFALLLARFFLFRTGKSLKDVDYKNMEQYLIETVNLAKKYSYCGSDDDILYIRDIFKKIRLIFLNFRFLFSDINGYIHNFNSHDGINALCTYKTRNTILNVKMKRVITENKKIHK
jgi:hypothetical protein